MLWKYKGITYQQLMVACIGIAGVWNAQRTKQSDRVWIYTDFHPDHFEQSTPRTGREVVRDVVTVMCGEMEWAEGWGLNSI